MSKVGMDVAAMHILQAEFERTAHDINGLVFRLDGVLRHGIVEWLGDVAREYSNLWSLRSKLVLLAVEVQLLQLAGELKREIAAQEAASSPEAVYSGLGLLPPAYRARLGLHASSVYAGGRLRITAAHRYDAFGPRSVGDLFDPLHNDKLGHSDDPQSVYHYPGGISVSLTGDPPHRHAVVTVSGTEDWGLGGSNISDSATNLQNALGLHSAKQDAIREAMLQAGVQPADEVMLVGHSQGGSDAIYFATDHAKDEAFHITSVVTIGAPDVSRYPPPDVDVLELRGTHDLVTSAGFGDTTPGTNVHVVHVPQPLLVSPLTAHDPAYYQQRLPADAPAVADFESRHGGFFTGGDSTSVVFSNERAGVNPVLDAVGHPLR